MVVRIQKHLSAWLSGCLSVCLSRFLPVCMIVWPTRYICLSVCVSVCLAGWLSGCLVVRLYPSDWFTVCQAVMLSVCLSDWLSSWLSVCLFICLARRQSLCLCGSQTVNLFVCLSACLSHWLPGCLLYCLSIWRLPVCLAVGRLGCLSLRRSVTINMYRPLPSNQWTWRQWKKAINFAKTRPMLRISGTQCRSWAHSLCERGTFQDHRSRESPTIFSNSHFCLAGSSLDHYLSITKWKRNLFGINAFIVLLIALIIESDTKAWRVIEAVQETTNLLPFPRISNRGADATRSNKSLSLSDADRVFITSVFPSRKIESWTFLNIKSKN